MVLYGKNLNVKYVIYGGRNRYIQKKGVFIENWKCDLKKKGFHIY